MNHISKNRTRRQDAECTEGREKGKGRPYSITERRVPELIPVLGSHRPTRVVPDKGPLNGCVCVSVLQYCVVAVVFTCRRLCVSIKKVKEGRTRLPSIGFSSAAYCYRLSIVI